MYAACTPVGPRTTLYNSNSARGRGLPAGMPSEPGKCYAKVKVPKSFTRKAGVFPMYTGTDSSSVDFSKHVVSEGQKSTKWVKKKADKNCRSSDPNDCLVWCLVESIADEISFLYLSDTTQTEEFAMENVELEIPEENAGESKWMEVLCQSQLTNGIYEDMYLELTILGYYSGEILGESSSELTKSLKEFQMDKGLHVGAFTVETVEALGLKI